MTEEQATALVELAQGGSQAAMDRLTRHFWSDLERLVGSFFQKGVPRSVPQEDMLQEAWIGFRNALLRFDPGRGLAIRTFVMCRAKGQVLDYLRDHGQLFSPKRNLGKTCIPKAKSLHGYYHNGGDYRNGEDRDYEPADGGGRCDPNMEAMEWIENFEGLTEGLHPKSREMLFLYYVCGLRMKEIGRRFELTESRISQIFADLNELIRAKVTGKPVAATPKQERAAAARIAKAAPLRDAVC